MTVSRIESRCLVPGYGYGTVLKETRGWVLIQFDDIADEFSDDTLWIHENRVTFAEPHVEDYQQII